MQNSTGNFAATAGFLLTRVIVPLWVLAGATFKLIEANPANLPKQIWRNAADLGIDLEWLLVALISIEFLMAAMMIFIARLARPAAVFMLSIFCLVLLNELRTGNFESCGCLGNVPIKPWQMLAIDGGLLAGVIVTSLMAPLSMRPWRYGPVAAAALTLAGIVASIAQIIPDKRTDVVIDPQPQPPPTISNGESPLPPQPTNLPPRPPKTYVTPNDVSVWVGKPWREIDLLQFLPQPPRSIDQGTRYVVFYSRSCEHCEQMFWDHLIMPIGEHVTAVEIPGPQTWDMPPTKCELMSLPAGTNWLFTPPLAIKVVDGVVQCASEADHTKCMDVQ